MKEEPYDWGSMNAEATTEIDRDTEVDYVKEEMQSDYEDAMSSQGVGEFVQELVDRVLDEEEVRPLENSFNSEDGDIIEVLDVPTNRKRKLHSSLSIHSFVDLEVEQRRVTEGYHSDKSSTSSPNRTWRSISSGKSLVLDDDMTEEVSDDGIKAEEMLDRLRQDARRTNERRKNMELESLENTARGNEESHRSYAHALSVPQPIAMSQRYIENINESIKSGERTIFVRKCLIENINLNMSKLPEEPGFSCAEHEVCLRVQDEFYRKIYWIRWPIVRRLSWLFESLAKRWNSSPSDVQLYYKKSLLDTGNPVLIYDYHTPHSLGAKHDEPMILYAARVEVQEPQPISVPQDIFVQAERIKPNILETQARSTLSVKAEENEPPEKRSRNAEGERQEREDETEYESD